MFLGQGKTTGHYENEFTVYTQNVSQAMSTHIFSILKEIFSTGMTTFLLLY